MRKERVLFEIEIEEDGLSGRRKRRCTRDVGDLDVRKIKPSDLRILLERQCYRCALTGRQLTPDTASVDHVIPLSRGGSHSIDNLQIVHSIVNKAKGSLTQDEFIALCRDVAALTANQEQGRETP
jgi:5-methylcytosine-specific restriction endonuclease McrA